MLRKTKNMIILLFMASGLLLLPSSHLAAQEGDEEEEKKEEYVVYSLGQQTIALSAGLFIPLFIQSFSGETSKTNLSLGGVGSLQWGAHLGNHLMLGLEIGGVFSRSVRKNFLLMLPVTAKGTWYFHVFPFEIPVFLGAGMNLMKYEAQTNIDFILKPGFSTLWKYSPNWSFGLNFVYWWDFQPWRHAPELARMGHFLEISLTAHYNF